MKPTKISILLLLIGFHSFSQSKLDRAKDDLKGSPSKSSFSNNNGGDNSGDVGNDFLGDIVLELFYFASYGALIGDVQQRSFTAYPYADGENGEYNFPGEVPDIKKSKFMISNTLAFQSGTYGNDLKLNYRFLPFLGVEGNHLHLIDRLDEGSDFGISSIMLNFYRIREKRVTGFWGLGATYVGNDVNTTGFAYNLGLDIYVANPISLGIFCKQSFINATSISEFRALGRYHFNKFAVHGGFIHYRIGDEGFPSAAVGFEYNF